MAQGTGPSRGTKAVAEVARGVISRCRVAWSARLDKSSNPTIVPRQSLSGPRIACFSHPFSGALSKGNPAWLASGGVFHCPNFKSRVSELGQHLFAPKPGRRERNFWMQRQGAENRH